jgi:hypothetical protein
MLKSERRPFPIKIYNQVVGSIGLNGDLDFDKLIKKSRALTGSNNFGRDFNEEAVKILLDSINKEAQLNPFGKLMIREKLLGQLENRLWAEHWFEKHPEILAQEVLPIKLITGLQRTGTTKMQRLLSGFSGARSLKSWEALYPAPIKEADETKKRIGRTRRNEKAVKWISPTFQSIHPIHTDQPEEDVLLLDVHFMSSSSEAIMHVPGYANWLAEQDQTEAYVYEQKLLQLLQWQRDAKFWVLKSPHHLEYLDTFTEVFPDTKIIWMHRPVKECIPSYLSMLYFSRNMFADNVDQEALKTHWIAKLSSMITAGIKYRKHNPDSIIDVSFTKFMDSEQSVLAEIVSQFDIELQNEKLNLPANEAYVSKHKYQLSDWQIHVGELKIHFSAYEELVDQLRTT